MRDGVVTDYIRKILTVHSDKKLVPGQSPGEPHKSEIERKIEGLKEEEKEDCISNSKSTKTGVVVLRPLSGMKLDRDKQCLVKVDQRILCCML